MVVLGPWAVVDDDPRSTTFIGVPLFAAGLVLTVLFLRYFRKPLSPDARTPSLSGRVSSANADSWPGGAGWYPPASASGRGPRQTLAGRSREKFSKKTKSTTRKTGVASR